MLKHLQVVGMEEGRITGEEAFKEAMRELEPVKFYSTVWRHSRRWAIPIPKGVRELLDPNQLYKIRITFTTPEDSYLKNRLSGILSSLEWKSYVEVTKAWKSGNRRLFPITKNTARQLVPKLQELKEATEEIIREATIEEAIDYLIKDDPKYRELKRKLISSKGRLWDYLTEADIKKQERIKEEIAKLKEEYRPKAEKLVEEGFKPGPEIEFIEEWIKAPLLIEATPYYVENERKAIALYKRAPMPLNEDEYL